MIKKEIENMRYTEIFYKTLKDNKKYAVVVNEEIGWERDYEQNVINRIESIVDARGTDGEQLAVVTGIVQHK